MICKSFTLRKVPGPATETCVIQFRGRPGVHSEETSVSGVCVVFPVWRILQSGLLCEQQRRE
jgi:hypothetical protein